jgi:hypothetical protein
MRAAWTNLWLDKAVSWTQNAHQHVEVQPVADCGSHADAALEKTINCL